MEDELLQSGQTTSDLSITASSSRVLKDYSSASLSDAHHLLLEHELLRSSDNEQAFRLVKTHYIQLQRWHEHHTGWYIQKRPSLIRLERVRHTSVPTLIHPSMKKEGDLACVVWIFWFAEKCRLAHHDRSETFTMQHIAEAIRLHANFSFDLLSRADNESMARALEYLESMGVVQGQKKSALPFLVADERMQETQYVFTPLLHSYIEAFSTRQMISFVNHFKHDTHPLQAGLVYGDAPSALMRAWRTLLLGPVLFHYDDPSAFVALSKHVPQVEKELAQQFGWQLEINRSYACIIRKNAGNMSPEQLPISIDDHLVLLFCTQIRERVQAGSLHPDASGCITLSTLDLHVIFSEVHQRNLPKWGKNAQKRPIQSLLRDLCDRMKSHCLLRGPSSTEQWLLLPTAARFVAVYAEIDEKDISDTKKTETIDEDITVLHQEQLTLWNSENEEGQS
jgi:uncharacterized protein (TIGR02678 family)